MSRVSIAYYQTFRSIQFYHRLKLYESLKPQQDFEMQPIAQPNLYQRLSITPHQLATFCQRWNVIELALFGSIVRDDFRADSDIDVLITLRPNHTWGLKIITMREELSVLCNRSIYSPVKALSKVVMPSVVRKF